MTDRRIEPELIREAADAASTPYQTEKVKRIGTVVTKMESRIAGKRALVGVPAEALMPFGGSQALREVDVWTDRFNVTNPHAIAGDHLAFAVVSQYSADGVEPAEVDEAVEEVGRYLGGRGATQAQLAFAAGYRASAQQYAGQYRAEYKARQARQGLEVA